jgi:hypothetical protein
VPNFIISELAVGWDDASKLKELASLAQVFQHFLEPNVMRILKLSSRCS